MLAVANHLLGNLLSFDSAVCMTRGRCSMDVYLCLSSSIADHDVYAIAMVLPLPAWHVVLGSW
jgi:hypothetical protein